MKHEKKKKDSEKCTSDFVKQKRKKTEDNIKFILKNFRTKYNPTGISKV